MAKLTHEDILAYLEEATILELNDYEKRVLIEALNDRRNDLIESDRCPYDVSDLLLRVIDAPTGKKKRDRDAR